MVPVVAIVGSGRNFCMYCVIGDSWLAGITLIGSTSLDRIAVSAIASLPDRNRTDTGRDHCVLCAVQLASDVGS